MAVPHQTLIVNPNTHADFNTISSAIAAAHDGDTIVVTAGTYNEHVDVNKAVTIQGANAGVAGQSHPNQETIITGGVTVSADNATIDGLKIIGAPIDDSDKVAVLVTGANDTVENSIIDGTSAGALGTVSPGTIGLTTDPSVSNLHVTGNAFYGYDYGIYPTLEATGSIVSNLFSGNGHGIGIDYPNFTVTTNTFANSAASHIISGAFSTEDFNFVAADNSFDAGSTPIYIFLSGNGQVVTGTGFAEVFDASSVSNSSQGQDFTVNAGGGIDTITYWDDGSGVTIDLLAGTASSPDNGPGHFSSIENAIGGGGDDTITGDANANVLTGNASNDTLDGGGGVDTLIGGAGNDTYVVDGRDDVVDESSGSGTDTVQASVNYKLSDAHVLGNVENLILIGAAANGTGNGLDNVITGNGNDNILYGLGGADTLDGAGGNDTANYGASLAGINVSLTTNVNHGGDAEGDVFISIENVTGSTLDDTIEGSIGNNVLVGGGGTDTLSYANSTAGVTVSLAISGLQQDTHGAGLDTISGFENLTGSSHDDSLTGNGSANILTGGDGNDVLDGKASGDTMFGGNGNDTYAVDSKDDVVNESGATGTDLVQSAISFSLSDGVHVIGDVENLTLTGSANTSGTGNALDNVITGNSGNNVLAGLGGADQLDGGDGTDTASYALSGSAVNVSLATGHGHGGDAEGDTLIHIENLTGSAGDDTLEGDSGNNVLIGGGGVDTLSYQNVGAAVTVTLGSSAQQDTVGAGLDTASGFTNLTGSGFDDFLTGNGSANVLTGGAGNDTLDGKAGGDTMIGGDGDDTYVVDSASDVVNETGSTGTDLVKSSVTFDLSDIAHALGDIDNLTLTGTGNTSGTGNGLANVITGNSGKNTLNGGGGNDMIDASSGGGDTLAGGSGNDTFAFGTPSSGSPTITDFATGTDVFQISAASFGHGLVANTAVTLVSAASAAAASGPAGGYFIFDNAGVGQGTVYWDANGGSGSDAVVLAVLQGTTTLSASDFHVI